MAFNPTNPTNSALFHVLTPAELSSIFSDEPTGPVECVICTEPSNDWVNFCANGHSFCLDCVTHTVNSRNPDCPSCRAPVMRNPAGGFIRNLAANASHSAFVRDNPNWEERIRTYVAPCPNVGCHFTGKRPEMKQHIENNCTFQLVDCPESKFGCTHKATRSEMKDHLKDFDHTTCSYNLLKAAIADGKRREDALNEKVSRLEGSFERAIEALTTQNANLDHLATTVGELRDREAATRSGLSSLRGAVTAMQRDTAACVDRLWRASNGRTGTDGIPIGPGSRAGGSARQGRERRQVVRQRRTIDSLQDVIDQRDRGAAAAFAAAAAPPRPRDEELFDDDEDEGEDSGDDEMPLRNVRQRM